MTAPDGPGQEPEDSMGTSPQWPDPALREAVARALSDHSDPDRTDYDHFRGYWLGAADVALEAASFGQVAAERDHFRARTEEVEADLLQTAGDLIAERDRARDVAVALEQELAEVRSAFREVLDLHEPPPREDAEGIYPWFSGDIGVDEMAGYRALLGDDK